MENNNDSSNAKKNDDMDNFQKWLNQQFAMNDTEKMMPLAVTVMSAYAAFQKAGFCKELAYDLAKATLTALVTASATKKGKNE